MGMLGYQFSLNYDPNVLTATGFASYAPFTMAWPSEITEGQVDMAFTWPIPEPFGTDVFPEDPALPVARIDFTVVDYGVSGLALNGVIIAHVAGDGTYPFVVSGVFSNIPQTGVQVKLLYGSVKYWWLWGSMVMQTLTATIKNTGSYTTKAFARFIVKDIHGAVVYSADTTPVVITPGQTLKPSVTFDTTDWDRPGIYIVKFSAYYLTFDGTMGVWKQSKAGFFSYGFFILW
jgi:hypothetical protein